MLNMRERSALNPYLEQTGYAARPTIHARLYRQLTDPLHHGALCILGRKKIGKSAFLRAFEYAFDSNIFVGVVVPLATVTGESEYDWWLGLAQNITARLLERQFTLTRLTDMQPPDENPRAWFSEVFLPPVLALIRPHRRLVLLLDDGEMLLERIQNGKMQGDTMTFLRDLKTRHPQLHIALTLDTAHEAHLSELYPLVLPTDTVRMGSMSFEESAGLLAEPAADAFKFDRPTHEAAYRLTGGEPPLILALGAALYRRFASEEGIHVVSQEDIKQVSAEVFRQVESGLRATWDGLNGQEQIVLRAISQLLYADPLRAVHVDAVAAWLADSESPLDLTTVGSALRSLEYREIVTLSPQGIALTSELMQRFLLENAYNVPLSAPPRRPSGLASPTLLRRNRGLRVAFLIVLIVTLLVGVLLLNALSSLPRDPELIPVAPTVTLFGDG
jgi:hypothetical protein